MHIACQENDSTMAAILGLESNIIEEICENSEGVAVPANYNSPNQIVISGEVNAVQNAIKTAYSLDIRRVFPLNVSGAFHSPLMSSAREPLLKILNSVKFNTVAAPVYQNINAIPETDNVIIKSNLLYILIFIGSII